MPVSRPWTRGLDTGDLVVIVPGGVATPDVHGSESSCTWGNRNTSSMDEEVHLTVRTGSYSTSRFGTVGCGTEDREFATVQVKRVAVFVLDVWPAERSGPEARTIPTRPLAVSKTSIQLSSRTTPSPPTSTARPAPTGALVSCGPSSTI